MAAGARPSVDLSVEEEALLAQRIGRAWRELRRGAAMGVLRDHLLGTGAEALEFGQVDTLDLLVQQDAWRMSDLAEALRVDPSTATRAVQRLVNAGLAERNASDDDGRVVMVSATAAGRQRHAAIARRRSRAMAELLARFSPADRQRLAELWEQFIGGLDELVAHLSSDD